MQSSSKLSSSAVSLQVGFQSLNQDFVLPPDFTKVKQLGKGVYGKVMHIVHKPSQRDYACKRFEYVFGDEQRARRLIREVKILQRLAHPCCCRLKCILPPQKCLIEPEKEFTADLAYSDVYLVMNKCDMDLKKLIKSSKHLEETHVKSIVYDILCALHYLHSGKIVHRDLKPANVLVNDDCTV